MVFDLAGLHRAIDEERRFRDGTWEALAREVGVSASTIRRFQHADDAEADGVLALIRWLGCPPEEFIHDNTVEGEVLDTSGKGYVRVDMGQVEALDVIGTARSPQATRTSIQRLVEVAQRAGQPLTTLTRISNV